jgi:hypothetical protein
MVLQKILIWKNSLSQYSCPRYHDRAERIFALTEAVKYIVQNKNAAQSY